MPRLGPKPQTHCAAPHVAHLVVAFVHDLAAARGYQRLQQLRVTIGGSEVQQRAAVLVAAPD